MRLFALFITNLLFVSLARAREQVNSLSEKNVRCMIFWMCGTIAGPRGSRA
jgi:hypothetical protein